MECGKDKRTQFIYGNMIYTALEYSKIFLFENKQVSAKTVKRRAEKGLLPSDHEARKLPGKKGWVIRVMATS